MYPWDLDLCALGFFRCAVISPKCKVADVDYNRDQIFAAWKKADEQKVTLAVFPELCLTSYTCGDLFFQKTLIEESWHALLRLQVASKALQSYAIIGLPVFFADGLFNVAALIGQGKIWGLVPKSYLPNQYEYYEKRWFRSGKNRKNDMIVKSGMEIPFGTDIIFSFPVIDNACQPIDHQFLPDQQLVHLGIEICEDLWAPVPPSTKLCLAGCTLIANLSASSEWIGKQQYRQDLLKQQSAKLYAGYLYAAAGSGESSSDLVFAGQSMIVENGHLLAATKRFSRESEMAVADLDIEQLHAERMKNHTFTDDCFAGNFRSVKVMRCEHSAVLSQMLYPRLTKSPFYPLDQKQRTQTLQEIVQLTVCALSTRIAHINPKSVVLGVSGGLDSTLTLLLLKKTIDAFFPQVTLLPVMLPGQGSSQQTYLNAKNLLAGLELKPIEISIQKAVEQHFALIGKDPSVIDVTYENSQARERTKILMNLANLHHGFVLGTSDLSEIALGFSTYNADQMSMYHLIGGIPKTLVKALVLHLSSEYENSLLTETLQLIAKADYSPELQPITEAGLTQRTEDVLGPYELHDFFLYYFYRFCFRPEKIFCLAATAFAGEIEPKKILHTLEIFYQRFFFHQFKRQAMPDAPKIGAVALSSRADWRMPSDSAAALWLKEIQRILARLSANLEQTDE